MLALFAPVDRHHVAIPVTLSKLNVSGVGLRERAMHQRPRDTIRNDDDMLSAALPPPESARNLLADYLRHLSKKGGKVHAILADDLARLEDEELTELAEAVFAAAHTRSAHQTAR